MRLFHVGLPLCLAAVAYFAYNSPGFIGRLVQNALNPLIGIGADILNFVFGV